MKNYITHIKSKPPHERRQHAMQLSAGIIAVVFVVWISTIGLRFAQGPQASGSDTGSQIANILSGTGQPNATLIVASSTAQGY